MTTPSESWHPMHEQLRFSDYGEWLDEGTESLVTNIADGAQAQKTASRPVRGSDYELDITHDADLAVYRAWINDDEVAILTYKIVGHRFVLLSTSVVPGFRKRGIATELIAHVLDDIRGSGRTVTIICPAVREFMDHYPQYEDLLDKHRPGVRSRAVEVGDEASQERVDLPLDEPPGETAGCRPPGDQARGVPGFTPASPLPQCT